MTDIVIVAVLAVIIGAAARYVYRAKKSGAKCIGCPAEGGCAHKHGEAAGCGCGCAGGASTGGASTCGCHADSK